MDRTVPQLHAVIGVWYEDEKTFYVRRSSKMKNYPLVWSLLSIQYELSSLPDPNDLKTVQSMMEVMSKQRLGGVPLNVKRFLASDNSDHNPIERHVFLHLYEIEILTPPILNPDYYVDSDWLTFEEYEIRNVDSQCGLCMRMWGDYAFLHGITDRPFNPPPTMEKPNE